MEMHFISETYHCQHMWKEMKTLAEADQTDTTDDVCSTFYRDGSAQQWDW